MRIRAITVLLLTMSVSAFADKVSFLPLLLQPAPKGYLAQLQRGPDSDTDDPDAAAEFRLMTMKDEHGRIPPNAFVVANEHRRNNLKVHGHSTGRISAMTASISTMSWTSRGPQNVGGRTLAILVHPANNQLLFAGSASGGIWRSTNGGTSWAPVNDFMANLYIGALAFDPLNSNTMYAGTGERFYDRSVKAAGLFQSTDGGSTWTQMLNTAGWTFVSAIAPQPASSNTILVATGTAIWRTTNAGVSWTQSSVPGLSMALSVQFDPSNGNRAVAGVVRTDGTVQAYYSTDAGATFTAATGTSLGGADIAVRYAPSQSSIVYAIVSTSTNAPPYYAELWRSVDGGVNYTRFATGDIGCVDRRCTLWVAPNDSAVVVTGGIDVFRSINSGSTFTRISSGYIMTRDPHPDEHFTISDPGYNGTTDRTVYFGTDGGVFRTTDILNVAINSTLWESLNATYQTTQFYGGAGHNSGSGAYFGGTQDNGNLATTSLNNNATLALGADGGFVDIDPTSLNTWYMEQQWLALFRSTNGGASATYIAGNLPDANTTNTNFISPIVLDPNVPTTLYAGSLSLWRSTDANAPTVHWSNPLRTGTNFTSAIAVAPGNSNLIYVGENGGVIQKTTNGTSNAPTWTDVDNNININPLPNRYVARIYIDPGDNNTVYVAFGSFSSDNLWKTTNGGSTWTPIVGSGANALPPAPIRAIARHPRNAQRLYVGTDVGIYESEDGGATWSAAQEGPADVSIDELRFVVGTEIVLAATHGRGLWTADVSSVPTLTGPTGLVATATSTTSVSLTWNAVAGATSYQILRSNDGGAYAPLSASPTTNSYTDTSVVASKTYLYKVKASFSGGLSDASNVDFATTVMFTDDNALGGKTVLALHLQEVRTAVNAVRAAASLAALTFSNPATFGSTILATDVTDLRTGLVAAYNALQLTPPTFGETITATSTIVKATHWQEIRNGVK